MSFSFDNSYARLPSQFFEPTPPARVPDPQLVCVNDRLARQLGIDPLWLRSQSGISTLAGNTLPEGAEPIAQAYAGHQFGGWSPRLGDGRAVLLGEHISPSGQRYDIQLKGAGRTMFSRGGDGKATLGSTVREYLLSEAMHALGVPTTRALAVVTTGENIARDEPHPGAIFTRIANSHLRVGTFQYFYAQQDSESVRTLADYAISRHYPDLQDNANPYLGLIEKVASAQAQLIAQWMQLGFIHGVMNTDNFTISGDTIDYGPCAFMEAFHPDMCFSSIDRQGRYAWSNQAAIGHWNLARLGETLATLIDPDFEKASPLIDTALKGYVSIFKKHYHHGFSAKLGINPRHMQAETFLKRTLEFIANRHIDYTLFFRWLTQLAGGAINSADFAAALDHPDDIEQWVTDWKALTAPMKPGTIKAMQQANPVLIPRNHRVEQAIQAAESGDYTPLHRLEKAWQKPYQEQPEHTTLERPAEAHEIVRETFCGT